MVRRTGACLWRVVDSMVANRELRLETHLSEWDSVDEWVRIYQTAERKTASPIPRTSNRKNNKQESKLLKSRSQQRITHKSVPESSQTPKLQHRLDSKGSYKVNKSEERCKSQGESWRRPPLPKSLSGNNSFSGDHFMDREYMQLMQRRLLDQHEETLRRRIRQRQAEEAQRERQLMLAGLMPSPMNHSVVTHTPKRGVHSQPHSRASHSSRSTYSRSPRPRTGRPRPSTSPRHRNRVSTQKKQVSNEDVEQVSTSTPTEDDDLDEAAESLPPPPSRNEPRPRLTILLQACKAVIGVFHPPEETIIESQAARPPLPEEEEGNGGLRGLKYESPLIAKLREVENVEELYQLAEMIVAHTKHP